MKNAHFYLFLGIDFNNVFIVGYGSVPVTSDLLTSSCRPDLCCMGSMCIHNGPFNGRADPVRVYCQPQVLTQNHMVFAMVRLWVCPIWNLGVWKLIMAATLEEIVAGILVASRSWMDGAMDQIRVGVFVWKSCNIMQFEIKLCVLVHVQFRQSMMLKK